jgi:hypothetical protein
LLSNAVARLREAQARRGVRDRAALALKTALPEEAQAHEELRAADQRLGEAEEAFERDQAEMGAVALDAQRRVAEHEAARTRLVEIEIEERRTREGLERQRAPVRCRLTGASCVP